MAELCAEADLREVVPGRLAPEELRLDADPFAGVFAVFGLAGVDESDACAASPSERFPSTGETASKAQRNAIAVAGARFARGEKT